MKIQVIKIQQPIWYFYIWKISADTLIRLSYSDIRKMETWDDNFIWIQREIKTEKVKWIKEYLKSFDATFPNSVVLNINKEFLVKETDTFLEIKDDYKVFSIIDWQHRLKWLEGEKDLSNFEVIVTIYINLLISEQANLFSTINSTQTKVDPSLKYNLELESELYTPRKFIALLVEWFNDFNKSPLKWELKDKKEILFDWKIKVLDDKSSEDDKNDAIISWSGFARETEKLLYNEKDYFKIRNLLHDYNWESRSKYLNQLYIKTEKYILWDFYINNDIKILFKILYNYFLVFSRYFPKDWWNKESILNKTTWFWAIMKLFKDIYIDLLLKNNNDTYKIEYFTEEVFKGYLKKIAKLDWTINSDNYPWSWESSAVRLYRIFKEEIFWKVD